MRDQMDAQLWVEHHDAFSEGVDRAVAALRSGLQRMAQWDGTTHQLAALLLAFAITALTFNATSTSA